jgi:membrane protease YdiL (CAAX protease family)
MSIENWLHIITAYLIYIAIAILTSMIVRKTTGDLKQYSVRNSPRVLLFGGAANLIAMTTVLSLLAFWDKRPISDLGLTFPRIDRVSAISGFVLTLLLAIAFLVFLKRTNRIESLNIVRPVRSTDQIINMATGFVVLVTIVLQEEVLNRGYVTLNSLSLGPWGIILVSTTIFVLIHFLSNRASVHQLVSWIVSGLVLATSYLLSGSIWVPVVLHYATDAINTLVFNITGQYAFFKVSPSITEAHRMVFRLIYGVTIMLGLLLIYGRHFRLPH